SYIVRDSRQDKHGVEHGIALVEHVESSVDVGNRYDNLALGVAHAFVAPSRGKLKHAIQHVQRVLHQRCATVILWHRRSRKILLAKQDAPHI
ncbi:hypothetical protein D7X55_42640, partial [Corallococcus sp. AB049A]